MEQTNTSVFLQFDAGTGWQAFTMCVDIEKETEKAYCFKTRVHNTRKGDKTYNFWLPKAAISEIATAPTTHSMRVFNVAPWIKQEGFLLFVLNVFARPIRRITGKTVGAVKATAECIDDAPTTPAPRAWTGQKMDEESYEDIPF